MKQLLILTLLLLIMQTLSAQPNGKYIWSDSWSRRGIEFKGKRFTYQPLMPFDFARHDGKMLKGKYKLHGDTLILTGKPQPKSKGVTCTEAYNARHKDSLKIILINHWPNAVRVNDNWHFTNWQALSYDSVEVSDTLTITCAMPAAINYIVMDGWHDAFAPIYLKNKQSNEITIDIGDHKVFTHYHLFNEKYLYYDDSLVQIPMWPGNTGRILKKQHWDTGYTDAQIQQGKVAKQYTFKDNKIVSGIVKGELKLNVKFDSYIVDKMGADIAITVTDENGDVVKGAQVFGIDNLEVEPVYFEPNGITDKHGKSKGRFPKRDDYIAVYYPTYILQVYRLPN